MLQTQARGYNPGAHLTCSKVVDVRLTLLPLPLGPSERGLDGEVPTGSQPSLPVRCSCPSAAVIEPPKILTDLLQLRR